MSDASKVAEPPAGTLTFLGACSHDQLVFRQKEASTVRSVVGTNEVVSRWRKVSRMPSSIRSSGCDMRACWLGPVLYP